MKRQLAAGDPNVEQIEEAADLVESADDILLLVRSREARGREEVDPLDDRSQREVARQDLPLDLRRQAQATRAPGGIRAASAAGTAGRTRLVPGGSGSTLARPGFSR